MSRAEKPGLGILLRTAISFDVGDRRVHCPMVEADVGGHTTTLILDSGSTDHVLTVDLAERAGLALEPADPGTDHAGAPVASWAVGDVDVQIGGCDLNLHDVVAITGPDPFAEWNVGGFLSPQHLHPTAYVVIDLVRHELAVVEGEWQAVSSWLSERHPSFRVMTLRREENATVVVRASVVPFDEVETMINTGSSATEFDASAVPGLAGTPPDETGLGLSGTAVEGAEVLGQTLHVAGARFPIPALLVRQVMPPPPGLVGMDLLAGTVVAVSADKTRPVLWITPSG